MLDAHVAFEYEPQAVQGLAGGDDDLVFGVAALDGSQAGQQRLNLLLRQAVEKHVAHDVIEVQRDPQVLAKRW